MAGTGGRHNVTMQTLCFDNIMTFSSVLLGSDDIDITADNLGPLSESRDAILQR